MTFTLWRHPQRLPLYAQIGANIDLVTPVLLSVACKEANLFTTSRTGPPMKKPGYKNILRDLIVSSFNRRTVNGKTLRAVAIDIYVKPFFLIKGIPRLEKTGLHVAKRAWLWDDAHNSSVVSRYIYMYMYVYIYIYMVPMLCGVLPPLVSLSPWLSQIWLCALIFMYNHVCYKIVP